MTFLRNSIVCLLLLTSGCATFIKSDKTLTPFPPQPKYHSYVVDPVISHNKQDKTYIVTEDLIHNSVMNEIFIDEVIKWKRQNGIE